MTDGDTDIALGELNASHIGKVIQIGGDRGRSVLAAPLLDVHHTCTTEGYAETELTIVWPRDGFPIKPLGMLLTVSAASTERVIVRSTSGATGGHATWEAIQQPQRRDPPRGLGPADAAPARLGHSAIGPAGA